MKIFSFFSFHFITFFRVVVMSFFCFGCTSETKTTKIQETKTDFSPALHFEKLENQNRKATDSLEALYDMHFRSLEGDSTLKRKGFLLKQRTETILQHIDKTYYDLRHLLDNIPADKNYKEATILFFIGKNKKGRGYKLEEELDEYVAEIKKIDQNLNFTSPFASQNDIELLQRKDKDLVEAHFHKTFPEAAFAFLSALKKEVILIELQSIRQLIKKRKIKK